MANQESTIDMTGRTVVLAFSLGTHILRASPSYLSRALDSVEVQTAIKKALEEEAQRLLGERRKLLGATDPDGKRLLLHLGEKASGALGKDVLHQIEKTGSYRALKDSVEQLGRTFDASPMGVWVNRNRSLLVVVASGVAIGGLYALYQTRQGDKPLKWALDLLKPLFKVRLLGKIDLAVSELTFKPSVQEISVEGFASTEFSGVQAKLALKAAAADERFTHLGADGTVIVPLSSRLSLQGQAGIAGRAAPGNPLQPDWNLALGLNYSQVANQPYLNAHIRASAGVSPDRRGSPEYAVKVGLDFRF